MQRRIKGTLVLIFLTISILGSGQETGQKTMGISYGISSVFYDFVPVNLGFVYQKNRNQIEFSFLKGKNGSFDIYGLEAIYSFYPNTFKPCDWPRQFDLRIDNTLKYVKMNSPNANAYLGIYTGIAFRARIARLFYLSTSLGFGLINYLDDYHQTPQMDSNIKISLMYNFKWKKWSDCLVK